MQISLLKKSKSNDVRDSKLTSECYENSESEDETLEFKKPWKTLQILENERLKFSQSNDKKVLWTIQILADSPEVLSSDIAHYTYSIIRDFLSANSWDVYKASNWIIADISWREENLPIKQSDISNIFKSERIYLYGWDKQMNPWIYIKPYAPPGKNYTYSKVIDYSDYEKYLIYWFEELDLELLNKGYSNNYVLLIDFGGNSMSIPMIDKIQPNAHYPCKII